MNELDAGPPNKKPKIGVNTSGMINSGGMVTNGGLTTQMSETTGKIASRHLNNYLTKSFNLNIIILDIR